MLVALSMLWLPILLSAVFVFFASMILWTAPFWHLKDYGRADAASPAVVAALSSLKPGQYMFPSMDWRKATAEQKAAAGEGPNALVLLRNPGKTFSFPAALVSYLVYCLVISTLIAYVAGVTLGPGTHYLRVFRVVGTAGILAYSFNTIAESIWYGKPWSATFRVVIDGVIFGLLTAGTFGWLWPH
jgi:hypothetical protein